MQSRHLPCVLLALLSTEFDGVLFRLVKVLVCLDELVDLLRCLGKSLDLLAL